MLKQKNTRNDHGPVEHIHREEVSTGSIGIVIATLVLWVASQLAGVGEVVNLFLLAAAFLVCATCVVLTMRAVAQAFLTGSRISHKEGTSK
jgi:hypothetical protein